MRRLGRLLGEKPILNLKMVEHQVLSLEETRNVRVRCRTGQLWITEESEAGDWILQPGDEFTGFGSGRAVIEAVTPSDIEVVYLNH